MYSLVLFDLDGTLSDPLLGIGQSINHALAALGHDVLELEALGACVGPPLDQSFKRLTGVTDSAHIMELVEKYRERFLDVGYKENALYPEVLSTLQQLQDSDVRMALCTSKPEPGTRLILQHFGLSAFFEFLSCGDVGIEKWQQIESLCAAGRVDTDAIMIGDRAVDIQAGSKSGLATGAVTWGYGSTEELSAANPSRWFHKPADWLALLNERGG